MGQIQLPFDCQTVIPGWTVIDPARSQLSPTSPWSKGPTSGSVTFPSSYGGQISDPAPVLPCGVCSRLHCGLRTHKDFLIRNGRALEVSSQPSRSGSIGIDLAKTRVAQVDDALIRNAFTKSYAFHAPSPFSVVQPSSYRLDGFHDLPVPGGDQLELHASIWNFLNTQFRSMMFPFVSMDSDIGRAKGSLLMGLMSDPNLCSAILTLEATKSGHDLATTDGQPDSALMYVYQRCLEYLNQHSSKQMIDSPRSDSTDDFCIFEDL